MFQARARHRRFAHPGYFSFFRLLILLLAPSAPITTILWGQGRCVPGRVAPSARPWLVSDKSEASGTDASLSPYFTISCL